MFACCPLILALDVTFLTMLRGILPPLSPPPPPRKQRLCYNKRDTRVAVLSIETVWFLAIDAERFFTDESRIP